MLKTSLLKIFCLTATLTALLPLHSQPFDESCGDFSCYDPCCESQNRLWFDADFLYWQVQDSPAVIPLVIEQPVAGGLFDVILGGKKVKNDWHSGGRFTLGYWFDDCNALGAEVSVFYLGKNPKHSSVTSDANGSPRLRVPYFNVTTGLPDSTALATPGLFHGSARLKTSNNMASAEANLIKGFPWDDSANFTVLAGFRYWNFEDRLKFSTNSPLVVTPTIYTNEDKFSTQNNFYGGQIGACFIQCFSAFTLNIKAKLALGAMCQKSTINGHFQTDEFTGSLETFEGGYFALPTNIGSRKQTRFAVIPELNVTLGYQITESLDIHVGYSVLYANNILRASKQMSSAINPTQSANIEFTPTPTLVGIPAPLAKLRTSSLWTQGVNVGIGLAF